jgi:hypothetical protein
MEDVEGPIIHSKCLIVDSSMEQGIICDEASPIQELQFYAGIRYGKR